MADYTLRVHKTCASTAALVSWLADLSTDLTAMKITGFSLSTEVSGSDIIVKGTITRIAPADLTVAIADPPA